MLFAVVFLFVPGKPIEQLDRHHDDDHHHENTHHAQQHQQQGVGPRLGNCSNISVVSSLRADQAGHHGQNDAAGHHRADLTGHVGAHRVHQQMVLIVLLEGHFLDNPRGHGKG